MNIKLRANNVLQEAESELRRLIAKAAQQGEYSSITVIANWASTLNTMTNSTNNVLEPKSLDTIKTRSHLQEPTAKKSAKRAAKRMARSRGKGRSCPKFARSGDTLVKIAWSKSKKGEYKHKSPHSVLSNLVGSLDQLLSENTIVAMDAVLPLKDADGIDIPDYQAYLCLAWLRSIGAVAQKGRDGYTRNGLEGDLSEVVGEAWNNLTTEGA